MLKSGIKWLKVEEKDLCLLEGFRETG